MDKLWKNHCIQLMFYEFLGPFSIRRLPRTALIAFSVRCVSVNLRPL